MEIDQETLATIEKIARRLAPKFRFGFYETEDLVQEAIIFGLKVLPKYDNKRPLENFLYRCIYNELKNFKRNNYVRLGADEAKYAIKKNLVEPISLDNVDDENETSMRIFADYLDELHSRDIFAIIDKYLPIELRADYLRMKQGVAVPKPRRIKVETAILDILTENGYETGQNN